MSDRKIIYMDNNATTRVYEEVLEVMLPFFKENYFNPSSMYSYAGNIHKCVENGREQIADFLGCDPLEVCFVSCGTEGNNMAIKGIIDAYPNKNHVITTKVEHPAVIETCKSLKRLGYRVTLLDVDGDGNINLDDIKNAVNDDTAIVSIMYANNETGVIFPIKEIGEIVKSAGAIFHVDAVQAAGKIPINMKNEFYIDLLTIAGHKMHAPKGIGALYIKKGTKLRPTLIGGHQERSRRAGTENVPYIIGFGKAAQIVKSELSKFIEHTSKLRDTLDNEVSKRITDVKINGKNAKRVSNTTNISFKNIEGEAILLMLDRHGICTSSGSACSSGTLEPSPILQAMGVPFEFAHSSTRFSLSLDNNIDEIMIVVDALESIVKRLREISPYRN